MKKIILFVLFAFSIVTLHAQKAEWKEMQDFHGVMSASFHPSEENNLKPLRDSASVLLTKAKIWQKANVPQGYNAHATKDVLKRLVSNCKSIKAAVNKNETDEKLKSMIATAHDTFHEIMEKCKE